MDLLSTNAGLSWLTASGDPHSQSCNYLQSKKCGGGNLMCDSEYGCYPSSCNSSAPCCRPCNQCPKCNQDASAGKCQQGHCFGIPPMDPDEAKYCGCKKKVCAKNDCSDLQKVGNMIDACCGGANTPCALYLDRDAGGGGLCGSAPHPGPPHHPASKWTPALKKKLLNVLVKSAPKGVSPAVANKVASCAVSRLSAHLSPSELLNHGPHAAVSLQAAMSACMHEIKSLPPSYGAKSSGWKSPGAIVGYSVGGAALLGLIIFLIVWGVKHKK